MAAFSKLQRPTSVVRSLISLVYNINYGMRNTKKDSLYSKVQENLFINNFFRSGNEVLGNFVHSREMVLNLEDGNYYIDDRFRCLV